MDNWKSLSTKKEEKQLLKLSFHIVYSTIGMSFTQASYFTTIKFPKFETSRQLRHLYQKKVLQSLNLDLVSLKI